MCLYIFQRGIGILIWFSKTHKNMSFNWVPVSVSIRSTPSQSARSSPSDASQDLVEQFKEMQRRLIVLESNQGGACKEKDCDESGKVAMLEGKLAAYEELLKTNKDDHKCENDDSIDLRLDELESKLLNIEGKFEAHKDQLSADLTEQLSTQGDEMKETIGTTYVRWGRTSCPETADLVYHGKNRTLTEYNDNIRRHF